MDEKLASTLGANARAARRALGWTQADVAEQIGVSTEFYARIERGGTLPSVPTLKTMAAVLHASADGLLGIARLAAERPNAVKKATEPARLPVLAPPELRRLLRRLRKAHPRTLKLLGVLAKELER